MNDFQKNKHIQIAYIVIGSVIATFSFNYIIVPLNLFSGGFLGISQLLKLFVESVLHISVPAHVNIAGINFFVLNVPVLILGYVTLGKEFIVRTAFAVGLQTVLYMIAPIPAQPPVSDYLTAAIVGGIVCGIGGGTVLRAYASSGGLDTVGVCMAKRKPDFSVGRINIAINFVIYSICFFLFDIETVIYSLIFNTVYFLALDRLHTQNIKMNAMVVTKKEGISKQIMERVHRGVTCWEGFGAYTHEHEYILMVVISKYELNQLRQIVHELDSNAFVSVTDDCLVYGNFEKRL